jgi:hypothetical protein
VISFSLMEHKHKKAFSVSVEFCLPDFRSEHRFVLLEKERARQALESIRSKPWASLFKSAAGDPYISAWQNYIHELEHYKRANIRHREQILDGLIPIRILVMNQGNETQRNISVKIHVQNGQFRLGSHAPIRPQTPEGLKEPERFAIHRVLPLIGGFSRSKIKLGSHRLESRFSRLPGGDGAYLVNKVIYAAIGKETRLEYEIDYGNSKESGHLKVEL